jgi:hypothetical protein
MALQAIANIARDSIANQQRHPEVTILEKEVRRHEID